MTTLNAGFVLYRIASDKRPRYWVALHEETADFARAKVFPTKSAAAIEAHSDIKLRWLLMDVDE